MESWLIYILHYETDIVRSKDPKKASDFYSKLAWEVESCAEAEKVFPDMLKCPVCLSIAQSHDGELTISHKHSSRLSN